MKKYIVARFQEASTWRAIIWVLSAFGVYQFSTTQTEAIIALAMVFAGGAGFLPDQLRRAPMPPESGL